jgi:5-oxoprolinase (ATP-hydrolysing) subunit C
LVGNPYSTPLLEVTASQLILRPTADALMVVTGADVETTRAGHAVPIGDPFVAAAGDRVVVGAPRHGLRSYVAFAGGVAGAAMLGSVSPDTTLGLDARLTVGEVVALRACVCGYRHPHLVHQVFRVAPPRPQWSDTVHVDVTAGPESEEFESDALAAQWRVSDRSNHVGLRIDGTSPRRSSGREILSRGVPVGAVEVPPDGGLLLLLRGRLLTAGYPVLGVASSSSLDRLAQARPGDTIRFRSIDARSAVEAARRRQGELLRLTRSAQVALHSAGVVAATKTWPASPTPDHH